jgi:hypothetical protein
LESEGALQMSNNENENKIQLKGKTFNINQVGAWLAFVGTLFVFWQFMRDVHKDITDVKERISVLETQYGYDARLKSMEEKLK